MKTIMISGFLGSGKTELLKWFIAQYPYKNILVIENEIADYGVDGKMTDVNVIEINGGSISSVNMSVFKKLIRKLDRRKIDLLLIETSGAANLTPVVSLLNKNKIKPYVISVVDALRFANCEKLSSYSLDHIENSSAVILNKVDMINTNTKKKLMRNLRFLNAKVYAAEKCVIDLNNLLEELETVDAKDENKKFNMPYIFWRIKNNLGIRSKEDNHDNLNAYLYRRYGIVDMQELKRQLRRMKIPRAKGFVNAKKGRFFFSLVDGSFVCKASNDGDDDKNEVVIIGHNIFSKRASIRKRLSRCIKMTFKHKMKNAFMMWKSQQKLPERLIVS